MTQEELHDLYERLRQACEQGWIWAREKKEDEDTSWRPNAMEFADGQIWLIYDESSK